MPRSEGFEGFSSSSLSQPQQPPPTSQSLESHPPQSAPISSQSDQIDQSTPYLAASDGDLPLLQYSLQHLDLPPNIVDSNGFTLLHAAAGYAKGEVIEWLLGHNSRDNNVVNVNAKDNDGDTPLHHCDDASTAKSLISHGADVTIKNGEGKTALQAKEEELKEMREENGLADGDERGGEGSDADDSDDEDLNKLKELVAYLRGVNDGDGAMNS